MVSNNTWRIYILVPGSEVLKPFGHFMTCLNMHQTCVLIEWVICGFAKTEWKWRWKIILIFTVYFLKKICHIILSDSILTFVWSFKVVIESSMSSKIKVIDRISATFLSWDFVSWNTYITCRCTVNSFFNLNVTHIAMYVWILFHLTLPTLLWGTATELKNQYFIDFIKSVILYQFSWYGVLGYNLGFFTQN